MLVMDMKMHISFMQASCGWPTIKSYTWPSGHSVPINNIKNLYICRTNHTKEMHLVIPEGAFIIYKSISAVPRKVVWFTILAIM